MGDGDLTPSRIAELIDRAVETDWYDVPGSEVDRAVYELCLLRRGRTLASESPLGGDDAVRSALEGANREALVWLTSRAISYMDESGFTERVEPMFPDERDLP